MPPKVQRCSLCGTLDTLKWYILDRRSICSDCHDIQLNPPLDHHYERYPEDEFNSQDSHEDAMEEDPLFIQDSTAIEVEQQMSENPTEAVSVKRTSSDELETGSFVDIVGADEQDEGAIASPGMFSPRRLRRRICPVQAPVRRVSKKTSRGCQASKSKSGRSLHKKLPVKSSRETASTKSVSKLLHDNFWYQIGDIVSMIDMKDNTYYAQIRGLLVDVYNEKSAVLTWLLPTTASPPPNEGFDPATYLAGPEEDVPRRLTFLNFVMHAPSNYYFDRNDPYPRPDCYGPMDTTQQNNRNYVWTTIAHLHNGAKRKQTGQS